MNILYHSTKTSSSCILHSTLSRPLPNPPNHTLDQSQNLIPTRISQRLLDPPTRLTSTHEPITSATLPAARSDLPKLSHRQISMLIVWHVRVSGRMNGKDNAGYDLDKVKSQSHGSIKIGLLSREVFIGEWVREIRGKFNGPQTFRHGKLIVH